MPKRDNKFHKIQTTEIWATTFRTSLVTGLMLGAVFGLEIAGMGDLLPYPKDAFLFILAISLISAIICIIFFSILLILLRLIFTSGSDPEQKTMRIIRGTGIFVVICSQALLGFFEINRPVSFSSPKIILGIVIITGLAACVSYLLQNILFRPDKNKNIKKKKGFVQRPMLWLPSYLVALTIIVVSISFLITRAPIRKEPLDNIEAKGKVLLLGVDAAYWDTLLTLIEAEKLPNFERLIKEGASGKLPSLITMWGATANTITYGIHSPAVWNSIFTGKSPFKHGIKDFIHTEIPGIRHPFRYRLIPTFIPYKEHVEKALRLKLRPCNRFLRKTKAAWNILTDVGLKVGAIGWWASWPAEEVNGHLLSDRFTDPNLPNRWFPQDLVKQADVDSLLKLIESPAPEDLQFFSQFPYDPRFREHFKKDSREYMRNDLVSNLVTSFYKDRFYSQLGLKLLDENEYSLLAVYFFGTDPVGHAFTRFKFPELFLDVEPDEITYFGEIIDKYYVWVDKQIGKYLEKMDQNTTVVVCSDHGMGPWMKMSSVEKGVRLSGSHRKDGIVILWGNHIRKGQNVAPKNLLDILPTILYLIGMPTARDMDGTIIEDAIDPVHLASFPDKTLETYETKRYEYRSNMESDSRKSTDKRLMDRLRSLGYLK